MIIIAHQNEEWLTRLAIRGCAVKSGMDSTGGRWRPFPLEVFEQVAGEELHFTFIHMGLTSVPSELINDTGVTQLKSLNVEKNRISGLPARFGELTGLTSLNLSYNRFQVFPPQLRLLGGTLRELILSSYNGGGSRYSRNVSFLNDTFFKEMKALRTLDISRNSISNVPAGIGLLQNLTKLNICGNAFKTLPSEIGALTKLEELNLSQV